MTPGNPIGLECPHCGKLKFIQSIASGNTFGGVFWSDTKNEFPMFPSPSPVQYCPHCGGYYFIADAKFWYLKDTEIDDESIDEDAAKNGFGELTFEQANTAYEALYSDELTSDKKSELLMFWLFKFNDEFGRGDKDESDCPAEILARRAVVVQELIDRNISDNPVFAAELFRETDLFEKCVEILSALNNVDDSLARIAQQILSQAKNRNSRVFRLEM